MLLQRMYKVVYELVHTVQGTVHRQYAAVVWIAATSQPSVYY
jgi:hypothetical protein